ncbi:hypothetical protein BKA70DRAFT_1316365 [Coprinopsis sp. MPI-PUGE-AT-0042]|nr:hypothetical protein BKA70DRAFT_1316365 [Coprinopsis sp. MPI-PUGE-AT-0042]
MLFKPASLLFAAAAALSTFTAVSAHKVAPHPGAVTVQARADLFDAVADLIERSETQNLDARQEMKAFAEVFNRAACPAGFYFDTVRNRCCSSRTRCK